MTSPATDGPEGPAPAPGVRTTRRLRWTLWLLGLLAAVPIIVTLIGAATSPPHAPGVPVGRLVYLDADQPSEKTTILRGLYITQSGGPTRLLIHENEPQDTDAGIREWITEPAVSPDGTQAAYIKQNIVLTEETHTQDTQLWVMPLNSSGASPRQLLDLTKLGLKQIVGLTWTPDGRSVAFLQDQRLFEIPANGVASPTQLPLGDAPPLRIAPDVSATRAPAFSAAGGVNYWAQTAVGPVIVAGGKPYPARNLVAAYNGHEYALAMAGENLICHSPVPRWDSATTRKVHWGWSLFGGRKITSLHWSPDGKDIAYTVSKPPVPEDEIFYLDLADGKTYQLPVRTGRAAWDWTR